MTELDTWHLQRTNWDLRISNAWWEENCKCLTWEVQGIWIENKRKRWSHIKFENAYHSSSNWTQDNQRNGKSAIERSTKLLR